MLKDKVAIITGGSRGIGRGIALKFASHGASVVLVAHEDMAALKQVAGEVEKIGPHAVIVPGDVSKPELSTEVVRCAMDTFGTVDIVVNCAGIITRTPVEELSLDDWHRVIDVNLHGIFHMCRAVLPTMRVKNQGKIINMSSQMAKLPHPGASPSYEVSKAGVNALTRHLAFHYAKYHINVNAIAPGSINTQMPQSMSEEARERIRQAIPFKRLGEPEEVGDLAVFLASSMSDYITGAILDINGGSYMA